MDPFGELLTQFNLLLLLNLSLIFRFFSISLSTKLKTENF